MELDTYFKGKSLVKNNKVPSRIIRSKFTLYVVITAPLANRTSGDTFKIVASKNNTLVQITCSVGIPISLSLSSGEIRAVVINSDRSCYFMSTQPILLVQFSYSVTFYRNPV